MKHLPEMILMPVACLRRQKESSLECRSATGVRPWQAIRLVKYAFPVPFLVNKRDPWYPKCIYCVDGNGSGPGRGANRVPEVRQSIRDASVEQAGQVPAMRDPSPLSQARSAKAGQGGPRPDRLTDTCCYVSGTG
jgi:hypothetical protein